MRIPTSVRIGGVEYAIEIQDNVRIENNLCYGKICYEESVIVLSNTDGLGKMHREMTLLHEILHGIFWHFNIDVKNEEELIRKITPGLYQVLSDNTDRLFQIEREPTQGDTCGDTEGSCSERRLGNESGGN